MKAKELKKTVRGTKRLFLKKGTCSQTFSYILNREFEQPRLPEEQATDLLSGGIYRLGYQCGMLWGASLAVGGESNRRHQDPGVATAVAIRTTQDLLQSFTSRTGTIECEEITKCDWSSKYSIAKYMFSGKALNCFRLAAKWAPEAVGTAVKGLDNNGLEHNHAISCACEVVRKMGGSEEEVAMVAGFAGGLGLSGNGCGALAAAIWYKTLKEVKNGTYKPTLQNDEAEKLVNGFFEETDYEVMCMDITGKKFTSVDDHTEFMKNGGCKDLIEMLAYNQNDQQ